MGFKLKAGLPFFVFLFMLWLTGSLPAYLPILSAAALHEVGHLVLMRACGVGVEGITLLPFGVDLQAKATLTSYTSDVLISLGGIAANLCGMGVCALLPSGRGVEAFFSANLALALLNALPIRGLDGGYALEKTLLKVCSPKAASGAVTATSFLFLVAVGSVAVWIFFRTGYNFTLFMMCVYLFCGVFLRGQNQ